MEFDHGWFFHFQSLPPLAMVYELLKFEYVKIIIICIHAWIRIAGLALCLCFVLPQKLPPVRGASRTKAAKKKTSKQVKIETRKPPRIKSHDFKAWDKFDVVSQLGCHAGF